MIVECMGTTRGENGQCERLAFGQFPSQKDGISVKTFSNHNARDEFRWRAKCHDLARALHSPNRSAAARSHSCLRAEANLSEAVARLCGRSTKHKSEVKR